MGRRSALLVEYMHSACETPILHLDLQPNNLMICGGTVRLIDFDHAWMGRAFMRICRKRYGTVGCAAPEQYDADRVHWIRGRIFMPLVQFSVLCCREHYGQGTDRPALYPSLLQLSSADVWKPIWISAMRLPGRQRRRCRDFLPERNRKRIKTNRRLLPLFSQGAALERERPTWPLDSAAIWNGRDIGHFMRSTAAAWQCGLWQKAWEHVRTDAGSTA